MPKAHSAAPGWLGVVLTLGLLALVLAPLAMVWWPLAFIAPAAVLGLSSIEARRDRRIAKEREGESICQFARGFDCRKVDTRITRAVYEEYSRGFPLRPSDRLKEDLRIDGDDLDFGAIDIARRTGRSLAGCERNPLYSRARTLHDVVMFFQHQPLAGSVASSSATEGR
jgi:hypothetical protein